MKFAIVRLVLAVAVGLLAASAYTAPQLPDAAERASETITVEDLRTHLRFLASDELQGRGTGHSGNQVAELYLSTVFDRLGLDRPAGAAYLQPVELFSSTLGDRNELVISEQKDGAHVETRYTPGRDFQPHAASASRAVTAPVVFAGFGITAPEMGYDDYAGLDTRGRIVVVLDGEPQSEAPGGRFLGRTRTRFATADHKFENARVHGAVGLLLVPNRMRDLSASWPQEPSVRSRDFVLAETVKEQTVAGGTVSAAAAEQLLGNQGLVADLRKKIDAALDAAGDGPVSAPASFVVSGREARIAIDLERETVVMHNVLAMVQGTDPKLKQELVVVGAHFDHDGIDDEGRVYNGADDDGSGTVAVLETAEAFADAARAGRRPPRTVVFALWNGEERGLLGSRFYAAQPVPAGAKVVANVNLDMVGRNEDVPDPNDFRFRGLAKTSAADNTNALHILGYSYSPEFARIVRDENAAVGLTLRQTLDDSPQNLIRRSDHWPFLQNRVPAIFLTSGLHPDYHTPQDDVGRINFEKLEKVARLAFRVAWRVATDPSTPEYVNPKPAPAVTAGR